MSETIPSRPETCQFTLTHERLKGDNLDASYHSTIGIILPPCNLGNDASQGEAILYTLPWEQISNSLGPTVNYTQALKDPERSKVIRNSDGSLKFPAWGFSINPGTSHKGSTYDLSGEHPCPHESELFMSTETQQAINKNARNRFENLRLKQGKLLSKLLLENENPQSFVEHRLWKAMAQDITDDILYKDSIRCREEDKSRIQASGGTDRGNTLDYVARGTMILGIAGILRPSTLSVKPDWDTVRKIGKSLCTSMIDMFIDTARLTADSDKRAARYKTFNDILSTAVSKFLPPGVDGASALTKEEQSILSNGVERSNVFDEQGLILPGWAQSVYDNACSQRAYVSASAKWSGPIKSIE